MPIQPRSMIGLLNNEKAKYTYAEERLRAQIEKKKAKITHSMRRMSLLEDLASLESTKLFFTKKVVWKQPILRKSRQTLRNIK